MVAAWEVTSGLGLVVSIVVLGGLFFLWLSALFMLVADSMSLGGKIIWFICLTCFAPIAIPVYFVTRTRRLRSASA
jgi:hypothetical protein